MARLLPFAGLLAVVSAHPIQRVIDMLQKLRVKAKEEGETETKDQTQFDRWCSNSIGEYKGNIAEHKANIEELEGRIDGLHKTIEGLTEQIAASEKDIAERDAAMQRARDLRRQALKAYDQNAQDLKDTLTAVRDALKVLKEAKTTTSFLQAKSKVELLVTAMSPLLTDTESETFNSFLQEDPVRDAGRVREYDFKSSSVIELLKKMEAAFVKQQTEENQAETNSINSHQLSTQSQNAAQKAAQGALSEQESAKEEAGQDLAESKENLQYEQDDLKMNTQDLNDTTNECKARSEEYAARMESRAKEAAAIEEAVKILAKATGTRSSDHKHENESYSMFLQISDPRTKAAQLIEGVAKKTHSAMLKILAVRIRKATGPFKQIINQIQKMIFRLNKEQTDEDAHKNWCDNEVSTTQADRDDHDKKLEALNVKIDQLKAEIGELSAEIAEREGNIRRNKKDLKEAIELNASMKKDFAQSLEDSKIAQQALTGAIATLGKYYGDNAALIQAPRAPDMGGHNMEFTGTSGAKTVLMVLENCLADYSEMEAQVKAQDEGREQEHGADKRDLERSTNQEETHIRARTASKNEALKKLAATQKKEKATSKQYEALQQYLHDLEPNCGSGSDQDEAAYEERRTARDAEIAGLKEAESLLGKAFSFLARD